MIVPFTCIEMYNTYMYANDYLTTILTNKIKFSAVKTDLKHLRPL